MPPFDIKSILNMRSPNLVGIDMGNFSLKAVRLEKKNNQYVLTRVAILPQNINPATPILPTEQSVSAQIKELSHMVKTSGAAVHFSVNSLNSTVRYVDMPRIPLTEVRAALKLNSTTYLRQNFDNYTFDVCPLDAEALSALSRKGKKGTDSQMSSGKMKILAGGISSSENVLYFHAARRAGIKPQSLQISSIALMNCFEMAYPEIFNHDSFALLDIGFLSSSLTILDKGKPILTRVVPSGGKQTSEYIAQATHLDFARAESSKLQDEAMLGESISRTCVNLIREIRSSINFFEKNSDQPISKVYLTGASVQSQVVAQALSKDIGIACETWDPANGLAIELPAEQQEIFAKNQFALSSALGAVRAHAVISKPLVESKPKVEEKKKEESATA